MSLLFLVENFFSLQSHKSEDEITLTINRVSLSPDEQNTFSWEEALEISN